MTKKNMKPKRYQSYNYKKYLMAHIYIVSSKSNGLKVGKYCVQDRVLVADMNLNIYK